MDEGTTEETPSSGESSSNDEQMDLSNTEHASWSGEGTGQTATEEGGESESTASNGEGKSPAESSGESFSPYEEGVGEGDFE